MLLVLLLIALVVVTEVMWFVIAWAPFQLTQTRFLIVSGMLSMVVLGALLVVVRAVGHAAASAGLSS
jgi:hypothetical protein